jgi:hypothetical protein
LRRLCRGRSVGKASSGGELQTCRAAVDETKPSADKAPMSDERPGLDADEPHTPGWFTFLGLGLFLLAGIYFLATSETGEEAAAAEEPAAQASAAPEEAVPDAH